VNDMTNNNNNKPARPSRSRYTARPSYGNTWAPRPVFLDRDGDDDGYDAAKDAYLTGEGPRPHGFHNSRGY